MDFKKLKELYEEYKKIGQPKGYADGDRSAGSPSRHRYSPAARLTFVAQPATSDSAGASSPSKKGWSGRYCSMVRMSVLSGADGSDLCGEVDRGRAPRDAATAADASRCAELVHPRSELVRGPLAVTRLHRGADAAAVKARST